MKTKFTQQEILLITGTKFSQREWCERNVQEKNNETWQEQLEKACWNGILNEMFPEIIEKATDGKDLFLWNVRTCKSFLEIELSESSPVIERSLSIDPYLFHSSLILN